MKRIIFLLTAIFMCITAHAKTETINWYMDGNTYATTQCETGSDIILPQTPYKYGYTFNGWIGYTPIEYLESTGTQWIDTGIKVNSDYSVEVKGIFNCGQVALGQENDGFNRGNFSLAIACSSGGACWGNCFGNTTLYQVGTNSSQFFTLKINKTGIYNGDVQKISVSGPSVKIFATKNLLLFATKEPTYGWSSDIFVYVKIWDDNNTLIRYFIPVIDSDGVPCMFDKVEGKFYYNAGTGDFIAGPVITE